MADEPATDPGADPGADRRRLIGLVVGGLALAVRLVSRLGIAKLIDRSLSLLKAHRPFHESDHVLTIAYNVLSGGQRLEDIELRRQDEVYLDALGAKRGLEVRELPLRSARVNAAIGEDGDPR